MYLDIYYRKGNRKREFLGIYIDPDDTKTNRDDKLKLAENLKAKRLIELINEEKGIPARYNPRQGYGLVTIVFFKGILFSANKPKRLYIDLW